MDCRTFPRDIGDSKGNGRQPAGERGCFVFPLLLVIALLSPPFLHAGQESARLTFQKIVGKNTDRIHVVKKGESLLSIIKGIRSRKPISLSQIRRLNPRLRDINRIYPGQQILLPPSEQMKTVAKSLSLERQTEDRPFPYLIQESDSISRILLDKLKVGNNGESKIEEPIEAYRKILKLNPNIADMNDLPAGRTLLLPSNLVNAAPPEAVPPGKEPPPEKTHPALRSLLNSIGPAIERMKGSLNSSGSHFIPLQDATQISIDCSLIPSVELDDGTTVFLDYENRLNDDVRQLIRKNWHNYHFLGNMEMQGAAETLQGIIDNSQNYRLTRVGKPFILAAKPEISVFPDLLVTGSKKTDGGSYRQGIFLLAPNEPPLPETAKLFLEQSGMAVTQIPQERISADLPPENLQIVRKDLRALQGIALAEGLLKALGESPLRMAEVAIFRQAENGFNLSITADILLRKGERKLIVNSKKLPDQFVKILNNSGFEFLAAGENDKGRPLIESVLRGAGLPASFGYFSSRIPREGGKYRLDIAFSAISSVKEGEQIYLTDFEMPVWVLQAIYNGPRALLIHY